MGEVTDFFQKQFNVWEFLYPSKEVGSPPPFSYYKYMGSVTSPPCEENVVYFVASEPLLLGNTALGMLRDALNQPGKSNKDRGPNWDGSNRAVQNVFNRKVLYFDKSTSCQPQQIQIQFSGHWEKIDSKQLTYYKVHGLKPSGIPNSQVVSPSEAEFSIIPNNRVSDRFDLNALI